MGRHSPPRFRSDLTGHMLGTAASNWKLGLVCKILEETKGNISVPFKIRQWTG
jgi:hypothetical protein